SIKLPCRFFLGTSSKRNHLGCCRHSQRASRIWRESAPAGYEPTNRSYLSALNPSVDRTHSRVPQLLVSVLLLWICASAQGPQSASLHGLIRDSEGHPIAHTLVELEKTDSRDTFQTRTDAQGSYTFTKVPHGVFHLYAMKDGYADADVPSLFLKPGE